MSNIDKKNLAVIRQSFAQTVFTHQVQEAAASRASSYAKKLKYFEVALPIAVFTLLVVQIYNPENLIFAHISSGIAVAEFILLMIQLNYKFDDASSTHKSAALRYMSLRDDYRSLIADVMNDSLDQKMIIRCRDDLQSKYQQISDMSPPTAEIDYSVAQKRLLGDNKSDEQFTWSDKEIDRFLPEELRLTKKG